MGDKAKKDEHETFLEKRPVQQKSGFASFMEFLYNKETKKFLGRDGMSWLEITIFYIIFYSCLAAFWAVSLAIFVYTLDDKQPRWYGKGSIIGINPGVGYQPWLKTDPDSTLIHIKLGDEESYKKYVGQLDDYLAKYNDTSNTRVCEGTDSNDQDNEEACRFEPNKVFGECSKAKNPDYGYAKGQPCVALALNRLIGWKPVAYPKSSHPANLDHYKAGNVALECRGENVADTEHIGKLSYYPKEGMDKKYFPYKVMKNYHQPIAMVKFDNLARNVIVQVECLAYAYNIIHDPIERMGLIHFEILIDEQQKNKRRKIIGTVMYFK